MAREARAFYVMLETSWGETVDVCLARDDMSVGGLEARGVAAWDAMHDRTYPVRLPRWDAPEEEWQLGRHRTLVDWRTA